MGSEFYIKVENNAVYEWINVDGKSIALNADNIGKLAKSKGLKTLYDFYSGTVEEEGPDYDELWFDPKEGLEWLLKLKQALLENTQVFLGVEGVLSEISTIEVVMKKAAEIGARWHLAISA